MHWATRTHDDALWMLDRAPREDGFPMTLTLRWGDLYTLSLSEVRALGIRAALARSQTLI